MDRRLRVSILAAAGILLAWGSAAAAEDRVERSFPFRPGALLEVQVDRGHVEVRTGNTSEVRVAVIVRGATVAEALELTFEPGDGLRFEARDRKPDRRGWLAGETDVEIEIDAPEEMDLRVRTGGGHLEVDDVQGEVSLETGGGHLSVGDVAGRLTVESGGGHVETGNAGGGGTVRTGGGHVQVASARGDLEVHSGGGHISVGDVMGDLRVETGGGHVETGQTDGELQIDSGGGHVQAGGVEGKARITTGGGRLHLEGMAGHVTARSGGGEVYLALSPANIAGADVEITGEGDVELVLPPSAGFDLDVATDDGRVLWEGTADFRGNQAEGSLEGPVGGGGAPVRIRIGEGDLRIVRRGA